MPTTCSCGRPADPRGYAETIAEQSACRSVSAAKKVQTVLNYLLTQERLLTVPSPSSSWTGWLDDSGVRAARLLVEAGYLTAADDGRVFMRQRTPAPLCRKCYLRETRALYASIDSGYYERKMSVTPTPRRHPDTKVTAPTPSHPVAAAPSPPNEEVWTCGYCHAHGQHPDAFVVTTVPGIVSEHWCGMKVRYTGVGPSQMAVVHDPGSAAGVIILILLAMPSVLALIAGGPGAACLVALVTVIAVIVWRFVLLPGLMFDSDIVDKVRGVPPDQYASRTRKWW
jgi:hypothetical protein